MVNSSPGIEFVHVTSGESGIGGRDSINFARRVKNYSTCSNLAGWAPTESATSEILEVSKLTGVNSTLLAATWRFESGFNYYPESNPNDWTFGNADVGPLQINYRTFSGKKILEGIESDVFGTTTTGQAVFNGVPAINILAGGRILADLSTRHNRSDAAAFYRTGEGDYVKKANGVKQFKLRKSEFDKVAPKYDKFFKCLQGK